MLKKKNSRELFVRCARKEEENKRKRKAVLSGEERKTERSRDIRRRVINASVLFSEARAAAAAEDGVRWRAEAEANAEWRTLARQLQAPFLKIENIRETQGKLHE